MSCRRRTELYYTHSKYIAEFWNTISNIPFIIIGLLRLYEGTNLTLLYQLMIAAGICSAIHHATIHKYTIIVDWIPIVTSSVLIWQMNLLPMISLTCYFELFLAFLVLFADHVYKLVPNHWGHTFWHLLIALSIDNAYQSIKL